MLPDMEKWQISRKQIILNGVLHILPDMELVHVMSALYLILSTTHVTLCGVGIYYIKIYLIWSVAHVTMYGVGICYVKNVYGVLNILP